MISKNILGILLLTITSLTTAFSEVEVGGLAPSFTLPSSTGKKVSLSDFKDQIVVLEWINHGSPFCRRQYIWGKMQAAQRFAKSEKVIWLTICSSAPNKYGHMTPEQANFIIRRERSPAEYYLFDEKGSVGRSYGATRTPEMFIINGAGKIVYHGSFDDDERDPGPDEKPLANTKNYVLQALKELISGVPVSVPKTKLIGSGIIYEQAEANL
jgi:peroxiredoxin